MKVNLKSIKYKDIKVYYNDSLEGGGQLFGQQFIPVIRSLFGKVDTIYEICAGPAFIGFSLLANDLCNHLVLSDINSDALDVLHKTVKENKLGDKVSIYWSDCLNNIPRDKKYDLIIANPPHFDNNKLGLVGSDKGWVFHKNFYGNVSRFLKPNGSVLFQENYLGSTEIDFIDMIKDMKYIGSFKTKDKLNTFYFMWSRNVPNNLIFGNPIKLKQYQKNILMIPRVAEYITKKFIK